MRPVTTSALVALSVGLTPGGGRAQQALELRLAGATVLEQPARLFVESLPRLEVLTRLSQSSGVGLAFSSTLLLPAADEKVSCDCVRVTLREALDRILANAPLTYRVVDGQVVITPVQAHPEQPAEGPRPPALPASAIQAFPQPPSSSLTELTQQEPVIAGIVVDSLTSQPLAGAQVRIAGTERRAVTDSDGRFRIPGLSGDEVTLEVVRLGYKPLVRVVRVGASNLRLALEQVAIGLEEIVVTATGEQRLVEVGTEISRVRADSVVQFAPVTDMAELLNSRAPGVFVKVGSGSSVGGSRIRIRGSSSPSLSNEPLVYVDGIRVNTDAQSLAFAGNQQVPSRFNDINPDEIESIEVLKGPSASTLYGTEAANGVILITTKSGAAAARKAEWRFWSEGGRITEPNKYPRNYSAVDASGKPCLLTSVVAGACTQADLRSFNLLMDPSTSPFKTGLRGVVGASLSGKLADLNYFTSAEYEAEDGVYKPVDGVRKASLRGNFTARPSQTLQVQVNAGYVSSNLKLFADGGTVLGFVSNALAGGACDSCWFQFSPQALDRIDARQHIDRFIGSSTVRFQPAKWVQMRGEVGLDAIGREDQRLFPVGVFPGVRLQGMREVGRNTALRYTGEYFARFDFQPTSLISSRTAIGVQFYRDRAIGVTSTGTQLVPGTNSLGEAGTVTTREQTLETRNLGGFVEQQLGIGDRLFLTGGLRSDNGSSFGRQFHAVVYPKVGVSWLLSEEPFFPQLRQLSTLRVRAAWGQSGKQPGPIDAIRYYNAFPATTPDGQTQVGVTFEGGNLGNPNLKPERSSELELGLDAGFSQERISLALTYYDRRTIDALVFRPVAPSVGASTGRWENLAETQNRGFEGSAAAGLVEGHNLRIRLGASAAYNKNKLIRLGEGVAPIILGTNQRHAQGYPLGGYWMRTVTSFRDADGDGIIGPTEVTVTDTAVYLGPVEPPFLGSVQPSVELFGRLRVGALVALSYGNKLYNFTEGFRCNGGGARGRNDASTPLEEQARCIAHALLGVPGGFVEDAGFTKLRELSFTVLLPDSWVRRLGFHTGSLTVAGQNLATWSKYPGIDPDVSSRGTNFETADFLQPGSRRLWVVRANVTL